MSLTLTDEQLVDITGFKRQGKQAAWLKANGFTFKVNALGRPRVSTAHYEQRMGGAKQATTTGPAWGALRSVK